MNFVNSLRFRFYLALYSLTNHSRALLFFTKSLPFVIFRFIFYLFRHLSTFPSLIFFSVTFLLFRHSSSFPSLIFFSVTYLLFRHSCSGITYLLFRHSSSFPSLIYFPATYLLFRHLSSFPSLIYFPVTYLLSRHSSSFPSLIYFSVNNTYSFFRFLSFNILERVIRYLFLLFVFRNYYQNQIVYQVQ